MACRQADHFPAVVVVDQKRCVFASRLAVGRRQCVDTAKNVVGGWHVIADSTRGADSGTGSTSRTDHWIDADMFACGYNRPCRTDVQAIGAGRFFSPRMGTERWLHPDIKRFFKGPNKLACGKDGMRHCGLAFGIGPQVTITFFRCWKKG